ncbi:MAG: PEGA domain-containing protein [Thermoplasmata archaeon]|nr:PEGA domain-containing protein [Thermoplasmata archaeon]
MQRMKQPERPSLMNLAARLSSGRGVAMAIAPMVLVLMLVGSVPVATTSNPAHGAPAALHVGSHASPNALFSSQPRERFTLAPGALPDIPSLPLLHAARAPIGNFGTLPGAHPAVRPLLASSTASNFAVQNYSQSASIVQVGGSNQSLLLGAHTDSDLQNLTSFTSWFFTGGFSTVSYSTNAGQNWGTAYLPRNASWSSKTNQQFGDKGAGVDAVVAGSAGPSGSATAFAAETFIQDCDLVALSNCSSPIGNFAPWGIGLSKSTNSGVTWGAPEEFGLADLYQNKTFTNLGTCTGTFSYFIPANESINPTLAYSAANHVVMLAWTNISVKITGYSCTLVGGQPSLSGFVEQNSSVRLTVSTNDGASWSPEQIVGGIQPWAFLGGGLLGSIIPLPHPHLAIGPGPTYPDYIAYNDVRNGSTLTSVPFGLVTSTNNGTSWSSPADISSFTVNDVNSSLPGVFQNFTSPTLVADNYSSSPHSGNLYLLWNDNITAGPSGTPAAAVSVSIDKGITWSTPKFVSSNDVAVTHYYQPSGSVAPNGNLWVEYYGAGTNLVNIGGTPEVSYRLYGSYSSNAGATWAPQFVVSDTDSLLIPSVPSIGTETTIAATSAGAYASWTDCRGVSCPATNNYYGWTTFVASLSPATFSANIAGVNATIDVFGVSSTVPLPDAAVWEAGASLTITLPSWVPDNLTYVFSYQSLSGFASTALNPATVTYPGTGNLLASYTPLPAGYIGGTVGPYSASLTVKVNNLPVPLSAWNATARHFNTTVAAGSPYPISVTATGYQTYSSSVPTQAGHLSMVNVWLPRVSGWIAGKVSPANASLLVNGSTVPVTLPSGSYNYTVPWGTYWVNASDTGYTTFSQLVTVAPGHTLSLNPVLSGGWLNGSVNPISGSVAINGAAQVTHSGNFAVEVPGGTYNVTATAHGYSYFQWTYQVTAGHTTLVNIHLVNQGWILGSIGPSAAVSTAIVLIGGVRAAVTAAGTFNVTEGSGSHNIQVSAPGYNQSNQTVVVTPGNVSKVSFTLNPTQNKTCPPTTPGCPGYTQPPGGGTKSTSSNLLLYVGIGVVVLVAIALAAIMLMRRRPPAAKESEAPSEPATYDESSISTGSGEPPST